MNIQKYIKESFIFILFMTLTSFGYAAVSTVSGGDTLTATIWNEMKTAVDGNTLKLDGITNGASLNYTKSLWSTISIDSDSSGTELSFKSNGSTGNDGSIVYNATKDMHFYTDRGSSTDVDMTIKSDGNVGIGVISPSAKLHVSGTAQFDGDVSGLSLDCVTKINSYTSGGQGFKSITVSCDSGYTLMSCGDGDQFSGEHWGRYSYPSDNNTCSAGVYNLGGQTSTYKVYARCCRIK